MKMWEPKTNDQRPTTDDQRPKPEARKPKPEAESRSPKPEAAPTTLFFFRTEVTRAFPVVPSSH